MYNYQDILIPPENQGASDSPISIYETEMKAFNRSVEQLFDQKPDLCQLIPVMYQRQMTVRRVIQKGDRNHYVGLFASRINQMMVPFESALEKQACTNFESHPEIQAYRSQPYAVRLLYAGKIRTVYPDFELITTDQNILADIRHETNTYKPLFRERCEALEYYAEQRGMTYILMTDKMIRGQRLLNTQWLLSLAVGKATPNLTNAVWEWIHDLDRPTFGKLFHLTASYPQVRCVLSCLALDGHLAVDLDHPLREQRVCPSLNSEV
ncbi:MAG: hypothetical protein AB2692_23590 [Candidatus Thiodiazotropha sp.]